MHRAPEHQYKYSENFTYARYCMLHSLKKVFSEIYHYLNNSSTPILWLCDYSCRYCAVIFA